MPEIMTDALRDAMAQLSLDQERVTAILVEVANQARAAKDHPAASDALARMGATLGVELDIPSNGKMDHDRAVQIVQVHTGFPLSEVAMRNELTVSDLLQMCAAQQLLSYRVDDTFRMPRFQFDDYGVLLPGIRELIKTLPDTINPMALSNFLIEPRPELGYLTPRQWLLNGSDTEILVRIVGVLL
ncbi:hypothetical protein EH165_02485 [Nakamurella antarctica]|uniref:Antitoxin Xre/MbcA/ParS-like toxin-binding domain-containing protein n=1 Tax=Nakamurella antarctica TaxID=1902245 RepID=A0A3G8ZTR8_9ACTN|nr:hypothetical protein [Nakamurella antarctica]AZI57191.1 hypothetical protein EH165_02485 [Nakamurella antarctica]